ncbi:unnamed protein product, partial [Polarella glacialis]
MLAQVTTSSQGPHFGYNLKQYSVKSRDRQDSLPQDDLGKQFAIAWAKALRMELRMNSAVAQGYLYMVMNNYPDCAEAAAICNGWGFYYGPRVYCIGCRVSCPTWLESIPLVREDAETKAIITDKLKLEPIHVSDKLFGCLAASPVEGFQCSAKQVWHEKRLDAARKSSPVDSDHELFQIIITVIQKSFEHISPFPRVKLVSTSVLDEVSVLDCGRPAQFNLSGFDMADRSDLNGVYTENTRESVNGKSIFEATSINYRIAWKDGKWLLSNEELHVIRRHSNIPKAAECCESMWWTKKCCSWRTWSGTSWGGCMVNNNPIGESD